MGYKRADNNMTFAEMSLLNSMEHNRSLKRLEKISQIIDWSEVQKILTDNYTVGTSREGADAYSPMMLLRALLLQQWYHIDSDPELENQINDRISFKKFIGISFDKHSPDHSTFSRFRGRLSKDAMTRINSVVLQQFSKKGFVINEGVAVDARLVQSASHPISNPFLMLPYVVAASCHTEAPIEKVYADKGYTLKVTLCVISSGAPLESFQKRLVCSLCKVS